jgi:hypothetical protein
MMMVASTGDGTCVVVDLLESDVTACASASDCRVRTTGCCECGGSVEPATLIAVSTTSQRRYEDLVCDATTVCAACVPDYPDVTVDCVSAHCQVVR